MRIFQPVATPRRQAELPVNRYASWHTWSSSFLTVCRAWENEARRLGDPALIHLQGGKPYDYTFSLGTSNAPDDRLIYALKPYVEDLFSLSVQNSIILLDGLLGEHLSGRGLHLLFAFFRDALASLAGDPMSALYAPLRGKQNEFPVHADLYVPEILFNVFDDVPNDSSGASLFLSVVEFKRILSTIKSLPESNRQRIVQILTEDLMVDHYEEFNDLLYHKIWTPELQGAMESRLLRVKLYSGQGYLINDRLWLHGRGAVNGGVSQKRLARLIFNTRFKQSQPALPE